MNTSILITILSVILLCNTTHADGPVSPIAWEYKIWIESGHAGKRIETEKILNGFGAEGWELISVVHQRREGHSSPQYRMHYFFKRKAGSKISNKRGEKPKKQ